MGRLNSLRENAERAVWGGENLILHALSNENEAQKRSWKEKSLCECFHVCSKWKVVCFASRENFVSACNCFFHFVCFCKAKRRSVKRKLSGVIDQCIHRTVKKMREISNLWIHRVDELKYRLILPPSSPRFPSSPSPLLFKSTRCFMQTRGMIHAPRMRRLMRRVCTLNFAWGCSRDGLMCIIYVAARLEYFSDSDALSLSCCGSCMLVRVKAQASRTRANKKHGKQLAHKFELVFTPKVQAEFEPT